MSSPDEQVIASQNIPAAKALTMFTLLIADDEGRRAFKAAPEEAFNTKKAELDEPLRSTLYADIPDNTRDALEALSIYEMALLSDLDAKFIADGLWVDVAGAGRLPWLAS